MRCHEIIMREAPYLLDRNWVPPNDRSKMFISDRSLQSTYQLLSTETIGGRDFGFYLKSPTAAICTTKAANTAGEDSNMVLVHIAFQNPPGLPVDNELQVSTVTCEPSFVSLGLASELYYILAEHGYSVISDYSQYRGGKELWKKMARQSQAREFTVRVWSDETGDWLKDADGKEVQYNAANLGDDDIWTHELDQHEATTLLVLMK